MHRPPLSRFWRDRSGITAVEFALVLPVLMLLSLGMIEVGRYMLLGLKLQHAAVTMGDLAARDEELSLAALETMFDAMQYVVRPFDLTSQGVVIVSAVALQGGAPTIVWQESGAGNFAAASVFGTEGGTAALPPTMVLRDSETIIVAEVVFHYEGWLLELVPETSLRRTAFFRPRLGTLRALT